MELPKDVVLLDSLGDLQSTNNSTILVCGSHCGGNRELATHVKNSNVNFAFLNNAGIGKNQAGIKGLEHYEVVGVVACAVSHNSAEIGVAQDTWNSGIISHTTTQAKEFGIEIGDSVQVAVAKVVKNPLFKSFVSQNASDGLDPDKMAVDNNNENDGDDSESQNSNNSAELKQQKQIQLDGIKVTVTDSITFLNENNAGDIVVCGSHGGVSAGEYALKRKVKAVFFNDAGVGKNNAGVKSLETLSELGIFASTADCMTAEIFNGQDVLENGVISVCNQLAKSKGVQEGMPVKKAIELLG